MATVAVIVEPLRPNDTPLELLKTILPIFPLVVPAEKLTGAAAADPAEKISVEPVAEIVRLFPPWSTMSVPDICDVPAVLPEMFWKKL